MKRFWIEFEESIPYSPLSIGCGITANNYDDAISLLRDRVLKGRDIKIRTIVADIDVSSLDAGHVLPNMGNVMVRGVWFPMGYD